MAPRAASSTAQMATSPSQRTPGPTSAPTCPAPTATSQPSTSPPARRPRRPGHRHRALGRRCDGSRAPTAPRRRPASTRAPCGRGSHNGDRRPRRPPCGLPRELQPDGAGRQLTLDGHGGRRRTAPGALLGRGLGGGPVRRVRATDKRRWSYSASASTCSRSSPWRRRATARCSSASATRRSSVARQPTRSAPSAASCSGVASPSASASTQRSNCHGATALGADDVDVVLKLLVVPAVGVFGGHRR